MPIPDNDPAEYDGKERRISAASHSHSLAEVALVFERQLREHEERETERVVTMINQLKADAFPNGEAAHRAAHQAMIDAAKEQADFWKGLKQETAKKSLGGILHVLIVLLLAGLAVKLGLPPAVFSWATGK